MAESIGFVCNKLIEDNPKCDDWFNKIRAIHNTNYPSAQALISLLKKRADFTNPTSFFAEAKNFLCVALMLTLSKQSQSLDSAFSAMWEKFRTHVFSQINFAALILRLSAKLLNILMDESENEESNFGVQNDHAYYMDGDTPSQVRDLEIALITLAIESPESHSVDSSKGIELVERQLGFLDEHFDPLLAIWVKECEYNYADLIIKYYLLFEVAFEKTKNIAFSDAAKHLYKKIFDLEAQEYRNIAPFTILMMMFFQNAAKDLRTIHYDFKKANCANFIHYHDKNFSGILTSTGVNTGLGSLQRPRIQIKNFGPHFFPLGAIENFGIFQLPQNLQNHETLKQNSSRLKLWTHLISPHHSESSKAYLDKFRRGEIAMELSLKQQSDQLNLSTRFFGPMHSNKLAFTFFVQADNVKVGDRTIYPVTLDRYYGENQKISFNASEDFLSLEADFNGEMEIFPLAGKNHFWGANFLIAFSVIDEDYKYSWSLTN